MSEKIVFSIDINRCTACGACAIACMDQHDIDLERGDRPLRCICSYEKDGKSYYISAGCMHCADAPCVVACPTGCLFKDIQTGFTVYDASRCIGCRSCSMACPFGAPKFGHDGKMAKCDGCIERIRHGMEPACTRVCPTGALKCFTESEYDRLINERGVERLSSLHR